jgi:hypothetical protein
MVSSRELRPGRILQARCFGVVGGDRLYRLAFILFCGRLGSGRLVASAVGVPALAALAAENGAAGLLLAMLAAIHITLNRAGTS